MRVYDLIIKKRSGWSLSKAEINYLVEGYAAGSIPDYQMAAFAMAVYFQGMTEEETLELTRAIVASGITINLDHIPGVKVDKHSTGGVGDSTTLVLAPLVAAAGLPVIKLSGRGLGHTGGTLDKLESIPGFKTALTAAELAEAVKKTGLAVAAQGPDLVPADKKLYALRDVTATVDSIPLIAASIMAKKLAVDCDALVLDVKTGTGAFMKGYEEAFELARSMAAIGRGAGRDTVAVISRMDQPLGKAIGNALEVKEAVLTLRGEGPPDLEELCLALGGWMAYLGNKVKDPGQGREFMKEFIDNGTALEKFRKLVESQGGDRRVVDDLSLLPVAGQQVEIKSDREGYISVLNALQIGSAAINLGSGRKEIDDPVDPAVGIILHKKMGDPVRAGETLALVHVSPESRKGTIDAVHKMIKSAFKYSEDPAPVSPLICGWIDREGGEYHV